MADMIKIATRDSYGNALKELGAEFDNLVVLDADLAGATKTGTFKKAFPDRHFDVWEGAHTITDRETMRVLLGCGRYWTMDVDWVRVWQ